MSDEQGGNAAETAATTRGTARRLLRLSTGFWQGSTAPMAWFLVAALLASVVFQTLVQYRLNLWSRALFDGIEARDGGVIREQGLLFVILVIAGVAGTVFSVFCRMTAQRNWRLWLSRTLISRWLGSTMAGLGLAAFVDLPYPEARLTDDVRLSTELPVDLGYGLAGAALGAATFVTVLWTVGGSALIPIGSTAIVIPGFLVVAALLYAVLVAVVVGLATRRFVPVMESKNQAEAELRLLVTDVRLAAMTGGSAGHAPDVAAIDTALDSVGARWRAVMGQILRSTTVSYASYLLAPVVPVVLCAPKVISGDMSFGQLVQISAAFVQVQGAFTWIVDNYPRFAEWAASARRVGALDAAMAETSRSMEEPAEMDWHAFVAVLVRNRAPGESDAGNSQTFPMPHPATMITRT